VPDADLRIGAAVSTDPHVWLSYRREVSQMITTDGAFSAIRIRQYRPVRLQFVSA
jgi:hypothetical protein